MHVEKQEQSTKILKEELDAREESQATFTPTINPKSKGLERRIDHLWSWHREKQNKLQERRLEAQQHELAETMPSPPCNPKSNQLIQRYPQYKHKIKVEDRLQSYAVTYRSKQIERAREKSFAFKPSLSCHSSRIARVGSVYDRLYSLAKRPAELPTEMTSLCPDKAKRMPPTMDDHAVDVCTRLHDEASAHLEKLERIRQAEQRQLEERMDTPKINPKSLKLAQKVQGCVRTCTCSQPSPPPAKLKRAVPLHQAEALYKKQVQWKRDKQARAIRAREALDQEQFDVCTFSNPYRSSDDCVAMKANDEYFRKAMEWELQKQQRLSEKQQQHLLNKLKECTFHPRTNPCPIEMLSRQRPSLDSVLFNFREESDCLRTPPKDRQRSNVKSAGHGKSSFRISAGEDARILPYPWEEYVTDDGFLYYVNTLTAASQWDFPT
ncbi:hypothetical protein AC1031_000537 [Aphanomyces cochlioides]|nr:hypothetical protein AC1031_000537 [Aphanomyces cochlioides]